MSVSKFILVAVSAVVASTVHAQTTPPSGANASPPAQSPHKGSSATTKLAPQKPSAIPTNLSTCIAMLNDIGPHVGKARLSEPDKAALQLKGSTIADHCHQGKFKEAYDEHDRLIAHLLKVRK